jgi:hypothetical protein
MRTADGRAITQMFYAQPGKCQADLISDAAAVVTYIRSAWAIPHRRSLLAKSQGEKDTGRAQRLSASAKVDEINYQKHDDDRADSDAEHVTYILPGRSLARILGRQYGTVNGLPIRPFGWPGRLGALWRAHSNLRFSSM